MMITALAPVLVAILAVSVAPAAELAPQPADSVITAPAANAPATGTPASDAAEAGAPTSADQATGAAASVQVTVTVQAARLIILDRTDRIVEIWSNTTAARAPYHLYAARGTVDGPRVATIPAAALAEYETLAEAIDWSVVGLAYQAH